MLISRIAVAAVCWALLGLFSGARAQGSGASDRLITLLQFYDGGSPLSAAERADVDDMVRRYFAAEPRQAAQNDALNAKIIATLNKHNVRMTQKLRSIQRYYYATGGSGATPAQREINERVIRIVDAHDPVVVLDTAHKGVITRHVADQLLQANAQAATIFGVAGPNGVSEAAFAARIKADYAAMPSDIQAAMAASELNLPNGLPWLRTLNPGALAGYVARYKPGISKTTDPVERQVRLAEAVAASGVDGAKYYDAFIKKMMYQSFFMEQDRSRRMLLNTLNSTATRY